MTFQPDSRQHRNRSRLRVAYGLLLVIFTGFLGVPEASATDCAATFADVVGERVQLKACVSDLSNTNGDDNANFQFGGGVTVNVGDLLLTTLVIDGDNTTLNPPSGWTEFEPRLSGGDMSSNVWWKIATVADTSKPNYQFAWAGGNEKNIGYMLLFKGTSGLFNFVSSVNGNDSTPDSPSVTPNSPNNLILRIANIDQDSVNAGAQGPGMPGHIDLIQLQNSGNNVNTRNSVSAAYTHQAGTGPSGIQNFVATASEGSHVRTIAIEPYEFRFSTEDGAVGTSSVCGIEQITLSVTDRTGTPIPWFTGTVTLSTTNNIGAVWSYAGAGLTPGVNGSATYTFQPGDGGTVTLNYYNPNVGVVDFGVTYGNFTESTTAGYTPATLNILDCEFVVSFAPGDTVSTCGMEAVTVTLQDTAGNPATNYAGTMTINNGSGSSYGNFSISPADPAFSNGAADDGIATYTFAITPASPVGSNVVVLNYSHESSNLASVNFSFTENSGSGIVGDPGNPGLTVVSCEIRITYPGVTPGDDGAGGVCAPSLVTIEVVDDTGTPVVGYDGTIYISTVGVTTGIWTQSTVTGSLTGGNANDGSATYTFDPAENGSKTLQFFDTNVGTFNFDIVQTGSPVLLAPPSGTYDADLVLANCELIVTLPDSDTTRDVCTMTRVQFEIQANGATVLGYNGLINITTSAGQGFWYENLAETYGNSLTGGTVGNGTASYQFDGSEGGIVIFDFRNAVTATGLSFNATGTGVTADLTPPSINIAQCTLTITTANPTVGNLADVCRATESVTYTLRDRDGAPAIGYNGTMVMQTNTGKGNYVKTSGAGVLTGPGGNDGFATYKFDPSDDGVLIVNFSVLSKPAGPGTITLTANITNVTLVNTDATFTYRNCVFNISFPADTAPYETDVCSVKQVQIALVDFDGDPVDDYTGTINLSTTTGFGSWAASATANGTLLDPFGEDGAASYTFFDDGPGGGTDDNGVVVLNFTHTASAAASLNINVSDSITFDPGNPGSANDPNLSIGLCKFQISFDGGGPGSTHSAGAITACTVQQVTIEVYDSTGAIASDYTGQINISTSTNHGNWTISAGNGALSNVVVNGGEVSYTFVDDGPGGGADDNGVVTLNFSSQVPELLNFNIVDEVVALGLDGVIVEAGTADPNLSIGSCVPTVQAFSCTNGGNGLSTSLAIGAQATDPNQRGRMVVIATSHEGDATVSNVSFAGVNFNQPGNAQELLNIRADEGTFDSYTTLWAMNDATLPSAAGSYNAVVSHGDNNLSFCAFYLTDVEQAFPTTAIPGQDGQLNAISSTADGPTKLSTTITTTENNALILSIAGNGANGTFSNVSPSPPLSRLFQGPNPDSAVFAGSSGNASTAGAITIDETASNATNRYTHIVAAFNPLISGPPVASGYVPVTLFRTYTGNMSYRAIGASFQTSANGTNNCTMTNTASATLTLPDVADGVLSGSGDPFSANGEFDSDIQAAWLYWFASGSYDLPNISGTAPPVANTASTDDFDNVTFTTPNGLGGFNVTNITADGVYVIENAGSGSNSDYYVGYKDVTSLMVGTNNEGTGSDQNPNGVYTVTNIEMDFGQPWVSTGACAGGFAMVVVYENPYEQLRVMNLFQGFQPFQHSAFTLVPRNFRISARDTDTNSPNGQVTHITVEGDATISGSNEALTIQDDPLDFDPGSFNSLFTDFNPQFEEFNGTITRPRYVLADVVPGGADTPDEYVYKFDSSSAPNGNPSNGYEIDFPNPALFPFSPPGPVRAQYGLSYGVDIDTHFIDGDDPGDILYNFADPLNLAEEITTRYAADQDLVLLVAEMISVTNAPIADIEVTISEASPLFKVGSTGTYNIDVKNNGNGAISFGTATGFIELVGELPSGMTFGGGAVSGTGWTCANNATAFTCTYDIPPVPGLGNASLPNVSATVNIGSPPANFPSLNNNAKVIVRVQHSDGTCLGGSIGVLPTPSPGCEAPEFDNVNNLQGGALDINDIDDKTGSNNNVHSITTVVKGIQTNLSVVKTVPGVLEEGTSDTILYNIAVTNNGPDAIVGSMTQPTITITDNEPVGINFDSASGPNWTCSINEVLNPDRLTCTFDTLGIGSLPSGATTNITVVGDVTGSSPTPVTNTVQVTAGTYNFDNVPGNNTSQVTVNITAPPAAVTDRFLLSVSAAAAANTTSLGSGGGTLSNFSDDDIVLYDPQTDSAELFIDSATTPNYNVTDPNAIHLLPNGMVVMSANADGNTIGTNNQAFDKHDLVLYDRLRNTATLFFDGSIIVDDAMDAIDLNIDAVYVLDDGSFIFSTAGPASDGGVVSWSDSDLVRYDGVNFSIYLDAEDNNVFSTDAQVDAFYLRVDPDDSTDVIDTFVVSSEVEGAVLGDDSVQVGRDDIAELTIDAGSRPSPTATTSTNLFNGNIPIGVFDTTEADLKINALHIVETAYFGHFEVTESQQGNACSPGKIRIRKHKTLSPSTHVVDTNYTGSIVITTDTNDGTWSVDVGTPGNLDNSYGGGSDNGQALYTFAPGDNGEVILSLDVEQNPPMNDSVNVSVTNGFVVDEDNDGPFLFNLVTTEVTYRDNFTIAAYDNNDGTAGWSSTWVEVDAFNGVSPGSGAGLTTGNVRMLGGKLSLRSNLNTDGGSIDPSMARPAALGLFAQSEPVSIKYDYGYQSVTNAGDVIELQISSSGLDNEYVTVKTYNTLDGSSVSDISEDIDLSLIPAAAPVLAAIDGINPNLYVRWEITAGYVLGTFTVDNFEVATATTACNITAFDHYHIDIPSNGLACIASTVRIEGHDFQHNLVAPGNGTQINLSTSTGAGTWASILQGAGALIDIGGISNTDGQGTYTFAGDEEFVELAFNYTDPVGDTPLVNINVTDGTNTELQDLSHDPSSTFAEVGLLFYNQTALNTSLPFQIAGKPSLTAPSSGNVTLQIVRSVPIGGENPAAACESLVDDGDIVTIKLAGLCVDPAGCDTSTMSVFDSAAIEQNTVPVFNSPTANPEASGLPVTLQFADLGAPINGEQNIGAPINFIYPDAGKISLHAEYDIPFNNDSTVSGIQSGDTINGASNTFIVRPFGFDIDFSDDRSSGGGLSVAADENGPAFARAGVGFNATVSAVLWEQADDLNADGIPDFEADLSNNAIATNFGDEAADSNTVVISVVTDDPNIPGAGDNPGVPGGVVGNIVVDAMSGLSDIFQSFSGGVSGPQLIAIDEVGIFDLAVQLIDNNVDRNPINYFESTPYTPVEGVVGGVANVGRIYPDHFELVSSSFGPRVNQPMACAMTSPFTYMSEDFGLNFSIRAANGLDNVTQNYRDGFAKMSAFSELNISAITDVVAQPDTDQTSRLVNSSIPVTFEGSWTAGELTLSGNMNFARQVSGAEDGPFAAVQIAFGPIDDNDDGVGGNNDVLLDVLDVDIDDGLTEPGTNVLKKVDGGTHDFRYGRLFLDNAFGPETEPLDIPLRIEYFNGSTFVVNTDDHCTTLFYDASSPALSFVPGTTEGYAGNPLNIDDGETANDPIIENGLDATINVFNGVTNREQDGDTIADNDPDRPFFTTPPATEEIGRVLIEFDLEHPSLLTPLGFLKYDWRGGAGEEDAYDEVPEGSGYDDNPRSIIEFGSYRGHDRVINWQEIYIGPTL